MELVLWRHADAEDGIPDEARKLTPKGIRQAERMAAWLRERLPQHARILNSPVWSDEHVENHDARHVG